MTKKMKIKTEKLISDLIKRTNKNLKEAENLNRQSIKKLNWKPSTDSQNALECVKLLNLYGSFYLTEIEKSINQSTFHPEEYFQSRLSGNYFVKEIRPKENGAKMKTLKSNGTIDRALTKSLVHRFVIQQRHILLLLNKSKTVSLNKTKVANSIYKGTKFKLGEAFRVVIYQNKRQLTQVRHILNKL